jgi:hypothetical protein
MSGEDILAVVGIIGMPLWIAGWVYYFVRYYRRPSPKP